MPQFSRASGLKATGFQKVTGFHRVFYGMNTKDYCVYILTNTSRRALYIGMTSNLDRRLAQHDRGEGSAFCARYGLRTLVHVEQYGDPRTAIEREKQLKSWSRARKERLLDRENPDWRGR